MSSSRIIITACAVAPLLAGCALVDSIGSAVQGVLAPAPEAPQAVMPAGIKPVAQPASTPVELPLGAVGALQLALPAGWGTPVAASFTLDVDGAAKLADGTYASPFGEETIGGKLLATASAEATATKPAYQLWVVQYPEVFADVTIPDAMGGPTFTAAENEAVLKPLLDIHQAQAVDAAAWANEGPAPMGTAEAPQKQLRRAWWGNVGHSDVKMHPEYVASADGSWRGVAYLHNASQESVLSVGYRMVLVQPAAHLALVMDVSGADSIEPLAGMLAAQQAAFDKLDALRIAYTGSQDPTDPYMAAIAESDALFSKSIRDLAADTAYVGSPLQAWATDAHAVIAGVQYTDNAQTPSAAATPAAGTAAPAPRTRPRVPAPLPASAPADTATVVPSTSAGSVAGFAAPAVPATDTAAQ